MSQSGHARRRAAALDVDLLPLPPRHRLRIQRHDVRGDRGRTVDFAVLDDLLPGAHRKTSLRGATARTRTGKYETQVRCIKAHDERLRSAPWAPPPRWPAGYEASGSCAKPLPEPPRAVCRDAGPSRAVVNSAPHVCVSAVQQQREEQRAHHSMATTTRPVGDRGDGGKEFDVTSSSRPAVHHACNSCVSASLPVTSVYRWRAARSLPARWRASWPNARIASRLGEQSEHVSIPLCEPTSCHMRPRKCD